MISDSERRAIAARLRRLQSRQFRDEDKPEITTWEGIGAAVLPDDKWLRIDRLRSRDNRTQAVRSIIAGRLADLIEPGEPKVRCVAEVKIDGERLEGLVHDVAVELTGIDRDALLALADEMCRVRSRCGYCNKEGDCDWADETVCLESYMDDYARRIREACGVSE